MTTKKGQPMKFDRSTDTERFIESYGVEYTYIPNVAVTDFDIEKSKYNQARSERIDTSHGDAIALAASEGAVFPPLIAWMDKGKLIAIDGNHRLYAAVKNEAEEVAVYVIDDAETRTIQRMTWSANALLNGKGASDDDRLAHAMTMVDQGETQTKAAKEMGLSLNTLHTYVSATKARRELDARGFHRSHADIPNSRLAEVAKLIDKVPDAVVPDVLAYVKAAASRKDAREMTKRAVQLDPLETIEAITEARRASRAPNSPTTRKDRTAFDVFMLNAAALAKLSAAEIKATAPADRTAKMADLAATVRALTGPLV